MSELWLTIKWSRPGVAVRSTTLRILWWTGIIRGPRCIWCRRRYIPRLHRILHDVNCRDYGF